MALQERIPIIELVKPPPHLKEGLHFFCCLVDLSPWWFVQTKCHASHSSHFRLILTNFESEIDPTNQTRVSCAVACTYMASYQASHPYRHNLLICHIYSFIAGSFPWFSCMWGRQLLMQRMPSLIKEASNPLLENRALRSFHMSLPY